MTTLLRLASLGFLAWNYGLYFPGLVNPVALVAIAAAALAGGLFTSRTRAWVAALASVAVWLGLRLLLVGVPQALSSFSATPLPWDTWPLAADRHLVFALPVVALGWFEGWWFRPGRSSPARERLVHALVLVALFWAQGPFHLTLYSSPFLFGLVLLPYLAVEAYLLIPEARLVARRTLASVAGVLLLVLAVVAVLWSLFGKYEELSTASGGGLMKPDLFQFDFSPLIRLETQISLSDHLVLLYREPGPGTKRYLRRFVLSGYDPAKGFFVDPPAGGGETALPPVGHKALTFPNNESLPGRQLVTQEYFLVNLDPASLLALNAPVRLQPYARWNKSSFVNAYKVESRVAGDLYWELGDEPGDGLNDAERQHDLRWGDDAELRELALSITAHAETPYEKALAVQNYLKDNFLYSLKPGEPGPEGALKHFLFQSKKGYCSYFAFSMALLLRSVGVPARVSVGFLTNPDEKVLDFYPVRAFQAHAWVEVPFGTYGWVDFDPTSENLAPGEGLTSPKGMDPDEMTRMIAEILKAQPVPLTETPSEAVSAQPEWSVGAAMDWGRRFGGLLLLTLLLLAQEFYRQRFRAKAWFAPPRQKAELAWRHLRWKALQVGLGPQAAETPGQWADRVDLAQGWVQGLERARYSAEFSPAEAKLAWSELPAITRELALRGRNLRWGRARLVAMVVFPWWPHRRPR
ncbi:MAG: transglutaminase-like domain-containing protein [Spirochaetales bacterium]